MKRSILQRLRWYNPKSSAGSKELHFFEENISLLPPLYRRYRDGDTLFGLLRAEILLRAILLKKRVDARLRMLSAVELECEEVRRSLFPESPFLFYGHEIFLPLYDVELNDIYRRKTFLLKSFPYEVLIGSEENFLPFPFDHYGSRPFAQLPSLETIREEEDGTASFYCRGFETLLVIDGQGILEAEIPLHDEKDKEWEEPGRDDLCALLECYFRQDRMGFLDVAEERRLLSPFLVRQLRKEVLR